MLSTVTSKMRVWAAAGMAAFYVVCLLVPVAAFAFSNGESHCVTQNNHGLGAVHVHDDGSVHRHASEPPASEIPDGADNPKASGKCCGLVCLAAMLPAANSSLTPAAHPPLVFPIAEDDVVGGVPARLYRPPALAI